MPLETTNKKKGGRPRKYHTTEELKAAASTHQKSSRQRRKAQQQAASSSDGLQVQFDAYSILQQAGPEGNGQITAADRGIQAEGLDIPADEEQQDLLEVAIRLRFLWLI